MNIKIIKMITVALAAVITFQAIGPQRVLAEETKFEAPGYNYSEDSEWDSKLSEASPDRLGEQIPNAFAFLREQLDKKILPRIDRPENSNYVKDSIEIDKMKLSPYISPFAGEWSSIYFQNTEAAIQDIVDQALTTAKIVGVSLLVLAAVGVITLGLLATAVIVAALVAVAVIFSSEILDFFFNKVAEKADDLELDPSTMYKDNVIYGKGLKYNSYATSNLATAAATIQSNKQNISEKDIKSRIPLEYFDEELPTYTDKIDGKDVSIEIDKSILEKVTEVRYTNGVSTISEEEFAALSARTQTTYTAAETFIKYTVKNVNELYKKAIPTVLAIVIDPNAVKKIIEQNVRKSLGLESRYGIIRIKGCSYDEEGRVVSCSPGIKAIEWEYTGLSNERILPECAKYNSNCETDDSRSRETSGLVLYSTEPVFYGLSYVAVSTALGSKTLSDAIKIQFDTEIEQYRALFMMLGALILLLTLGFLVLRKNIKKIIVGIIAGGIGAMLLLTPARIENTIESSSNKMLSYSAPGCSSLECFTTYHTQFTRFKELELGGITSEQAKSMLTDNHDETAYKIIDGRAIKGETIQSSGFFYLLTSIAFVPETLVITIIAAILGFMKFIIGIAVFIAGLKFMKHDIKGGAMTLLVPLILAFLVLLYTSIIQAFGIWGQSVIGLITLATIIAIISRKAKQASIKGRLRRSL